MKYDFVEIGTCDGATEIAKRGERRGISVEPLSEYLQNLPNKDLVIKENAAISNTSGTMTIYYIPPAVIQEQNLPKWMRGCNKVGEPHPTVQRWLTRNNVPLSIIQTKVVPVLTFTELCNKHNITEIRYLKIDTEGHDYTILTSLREAVDAGVLPWPTQLRAECNSVTPLDIRNKMIELLTDAGYTIQKTQSDVICVYTKTDRPLASADQAERG